MSVRLNRLSRDLLMHGPIYHTLGSYYDPVLPRSFWGLHLYADASSSDSVDIEMSWGQEERVNKKTRRWGGGKVGAGLTGGSWARGRLPDSSDINLFILTYFLDFRLPFDFNSKFISISGWGTFAEPFWLWYISRQWLFFKHSLYLIPLAFAYCLQWSTQDLRCVILLIERI